MPRVLEPDEVGRQLEDLPGWHRLGDALHGCYQAPDFPAAAALVAEVAEVAQEMDHHPDIDLRWTKVRFELSTHSAGGLTQLDVELAHRIASAAARLGAETTDDVPTHAHIGIDAEDPATVRDFWRVGLQLAAATGPGETELNDPQGRVPTIWFQRMRPPRRERSRTHVDVYLPEPLALGRVDEVVAAGGRLVTDEHAPAWWVLADPEGNELCICTDADDPSDPAPA